MNKRFISIIIIVLVALPLLSRAFSLRVFGGGLTVVDTTPSARSLNTPSGTVIAVSFDRALNPATVTSSSFMAFGKGSGRVSGTISFADGNHTAILTPDAPFFAGEMAMVTLAESIQAADGSFLPDGGYSFQFWVSSAQGGMNFTIIDTLSTRTTPGQQTIAYGGVATDFNGDGWADLTIVNEQTADLRVFLNKADSTGLYHPFLQPTFPVGLQASPSEPADFNGDGHADIAVVNIAVDSVSILLGNGDGTFAPHQLISVGIAPRGIAVLDADGDGDADVVNTNSGSGNLSILFNNGSGVFGAPTYFNSSGNGEWALAAADMDEDGHLDLVVGARSSSLIITMRNNGDGTFTEISSQSAGGAVWMLGTGDVNGDGHEDVHTANSTSNNGAILLGAGTGNLAAPTTYPTDPFPLATDLGDIDGDGDLDWITSSYGGDWRLFLNNGAGTFALNREFNSVLAASCALFVDIDNDGDMDLALIDEIADTVQLVRQDGTPAATPTPLPTGTETPFPTGTITPTGTLTPPTPTHTPSVTPTPVPTQSWTPDPATATPTPSWTEYHYLPILFGDE